MAAIPVACIGPWVSGFQDAAFSSCTAFDTVNITEKGGRLIKLSGGFRENEFRILSDDSGEDLIDTD
jgi:hypothetical protein